MSSENCPACGSEEFQQTIGKLGIYFYACKICDRVYIECADIISDDDDEEAVIYHGQLELLEVKRQEFEERMWHDTKACNNVS